MNLFEVHCTSSVYKRPDVLLFSSGSRIEGDICKFQVKEFIGQELLAHLYSAGNQVRDCRGYDSALTNYDMLVSIACDWL